MLKYRSVTYAWKGRGWTQEIAWLRIDGEKVSEWQGKYWTDFLNDMAQQKWELVTVASLGGGESPNYGVAAYFKNNT